MEIVHPVYYKITRFRKKIEIVRCFISGTRAFCWTRNRLIFSQSSMTRVVNGTQKKICKDSFKFQFFSHSILRSQMHNTKFSLKLWLINVERIFCSVKVRSESFLVEETESHVVIGFLLWFLFLFFLDLKKL